MTRTTFFDSDADDNSDKVLFIDDTQTVCFLVAFPIEVGRFHPFNFGGWVETSPTGEPTCFVAGMSRRCKSVVPEALKFGDINLLFSWGGMVATPPEGGVVITTDDGKEVYGVCLPDGTWLVLEQKPTFVKRTTAVYVPPPAP